MEDLREIPELQNITVKDGVLLRPLAISDAADLLAILESDPSIRERVSVAAKFHVASDVQDEIDRLAKDSGAIRYTVRIDDKVAGLVSFWRDPGFFGQTPEKNGYGFGFFLDPDQRGKGIAPSCINRLMDIAEENLTVDSFVAFCEDDNPQSLGLLKKLGFHPTEEVYGEPSHGWPERKHKLPRENRS